MNRCLWLLQNIEQRIRDGFTGELMCRVHFDRGHITRVRISELRDAESYPTPYEPDPARVGGKEQ
jgi:hypothetical protein